MPIRLPNPREWLAAADAELDLSMRVAAVLSVLVLLAHAAFVCVFLWPRLGTLRFVRLHYSAHQGVDWIGPWYLLLLFPAVGLAAFFANTVIAVRAARHGRQLGALVLWLTVLLEAFLAAGGVFAVLLNG